jgi:hypothetical protein
MKHRIATLVAALGLLLGGAMIASPTAARDSVSIAIGTPGYYAGYSDYYYAPPPTYYYYGPPVVTYGYVYGRPYHHRYHHHYYSYGYGGYSRDYYRAQ